VSTYRDEKVIKSFGAHLKKVRQSKGLTQEDLAEKANVAVSTIGRIETGTFNSTISTIALLAKALNVEKKELLNF
jgi:transcriptional regulator with XRE-family HTH domain